jgi:hypothetical protein
MIGSTDGNSAANVTSETQPIEDDSRGPLNDALDESTLSWKTKIDISIAKSRKVRGGNYVQIATVDSDGMPHCRTVVFRGFVDVPSPVSLQSTSPKCAMKMITDARSEKVSQILQSPSCEMVYWFGKSSEQ